MKTTKLARVLSAVAVTALTAVTITGCSAQPTNPANGSGAGLQTVNVGYVKLSLFAPIYVAEARGYFADEGIALNLQTITSGQDAVPLASSGKLDVVVAGFSAGMFNAISAGLDVKVVGSMNIATGLPDDSGTHLVGSTHNGITSIGELKDKKIGAAGGIGGNGAYLTALALKSAGLALKDVQIVNLGNPDFPAAIKSGGLDAALTAAPFSLDSIASGSGVSLAVPPKGTSGTGIIYGGAFVKSPLAQKFFNAVAHGARDLQNGAVETPANLDIVAKATGQSVAQLKAIPFDTWLSDLAPLPEQLQAMQSIWLSSGALSYQKLIPSSSFVETKFATATH